MRGWHKKWKRPSAETLSLSCSGTAGRPSDCATLMWKDRTLTIIARKKRPRHGDHPDCARSFPELAASRGVRP
jgi:hypothetical protein